MTSINAVNILTFEMLFKKKKKLSLKSDVL